MRVRKNLLETKEFFRIIRISFLVLALWASCSELFVKKGNESCRNRFLRDQKIIFLIKTLEYSQMFVFLLFTIKNSLRKFFGRLVKSVHVLSPECTKSVFFPSCYFHRSCTSWKKAVLWRFVFFRDFECKFYALWQNKLSEIVETSFNDSRDFLRKNVFFKYLKYFNRSCTLSRMFLAFSWEKAWMFVKTEFYVSRRSISL